MLASKLISAAAMEKGMPVMSAETIGMAQRGGSVFSHLRIGEGVFSPMIPLGGADLIIGFEPGEAVRMLPYLKTDGQMVVSARPVMPVTAALSGGYDGAAMVDFLRGQVKRLVVVDTQAAIAEVGSAKALNIILLGVAARTGAIGVTAAELEQAMLKKVAPRFHELNRRALACGEAIWRAAESGR